MKWHPSALGVLGSLVALLAACSVGPAYHRPDIAPPSQWHETAGGGASATLWPAADWWHGFGSPKLDELIAEAERNNDDLAGAIARVQEADAQARIAGAALLPSLDLDATATRQRAQVTGLGPKVYNTFNPELSASYELDFWGKNRALRDSARAAAAASRYDQQTVALTVVSSVATTYFQALELRDRIQVAQQNLENGEKILRGFRLEQSAGTATGLDVAQQETTVALLNAALPPLLQQFRQTVYALAVLIGKTPESVDVDVGTLKSLEIGVPLCGIPSGFAAFIGRQGTWKLAFALDAGFDHLWSSVETTTPGGKSSGASINDWSGYLRVSMSGCRNLGRWTSEDGPVAWFCLMVSPKLVDGNGSSGVSLGARIEL